jgi:hypothetical protein
LICEDNITFLDLSSRAVEPMALPNDDTLADLRFKGAWRPSLGAERLWERTPESSFTPPNGVRLHMKVIKVSTK